MTTWVKNHFSDSEHAMTTISIASVAIGVLGFAIILATVILAK